MRMKKFLIAAAAVLLAGVAALAAWTAAARAGMLREQPENSPRIVRGVGFVRGRTRRIPRNKFAGFAVKVHNRNQTRVRKGDIIFEYDDLDWRTSVAKLENAIAEQKRTVAAKRTDLELTRLDPLPSAYRNAEWKIAAAKKLLERLSHELEVYERLHRSKGISELALREKAQEVKDAEADLLCRQDDLTKVKRGLAVIYIRRAECELEAAELKLRDLERELELVREQQKYYRMVATIDGMCVTSSDTVPRYDPAGKEIASVHADAVKLVYAYFEEKDLPYIIERKPLRFRSNTYDCEKQGFAKILPYKVTKWKSSYGNKIFHLVECRVIEEPVPLRMESTGIAEIEVK